MKNIKVVWICHFSNSEIRKKIPLSNKRLTNFLALLFGWNKFTGYVDFAPWVTSLIKEFEKFDNIELHIVSPHEGLKRFVYEFGINGVHYQFFKPDLPLLHKKIPRSFFPWKHKYVINRYIVKGFIKKVKPDIVNLIGTENPYYSITSLDIKDIPVFVSVQTVYTNPERGQYSGDIDTYKWILELELHQKFKYYGCSGRLHRDLILNNNPEAIIFKYLFPTKKPVNVKKVSPKYDFVFFAAHVTPKKGIEDALKALAMVNKVKPEVTLNIVGKCNPDYKAFLNSKIYDLGLNEHITYHDYFPEHSDMHQHLKKSKFALLPVKLDVIPGTIIESMFLELPVITYKTTGTPYLNKNGDTVLISEIGEIEKLANNMLKLLNSKRLENKLRINARHFAEKEFNNTTNAKTLLRNYKAVINHYNYNVDIPGELLFSPEEFPIY